MFDGAASCSVLIWHIHTRLSWLGNAMMHPPAPHSERTGTVAQPRGVSHSCVEPHARIARAATSSRLIRTNSFAWIVFGALDPCARGRGRSHVTLASRHVLRAQPGGCGTSASVYINIYIYTPCKTQNDGPKRQKSQNEYDCNLLTQKDRKTTVHKHRHGSHAA